MFITGAGSGIGRGMALRFAKCGAVVICTDVNKETADETAQMIKGETLFVEGRGSPHQIIKDLRKKQKEMLIILYADEEFM